MEVQNSRPSAASHDARAERDREVAGRFAERATAEGATEEPASDAHTRLSEPVDSLELSEESRELARRHEPGPE